MSFDLSLTSATIKGMVGEVDEDWVVASMRPAHSEAGHHAIYEITLASQAGPDTCYLKATPPEKPPGVDLEARILGVLGEHSKLPVPKVYGVVDEHETFPAPYLLMEALPGAATSRIAPATLSQETHRRLAKQTGRYLAELHTIPAVAAYGHLSYDDRIRYGDPPSGDLDVISVKDSTTDWQERMRHWAEAEIKHLKDSQFHDLAPHLESSLENQIEQLTGPFEPAIARIDHSLENVLVKNRELTGILDWEFTLATTPGYDLVHSSMALAGGPFLFAPSVVNRWPLVFDAMVEGYLECEVDVSADQVCSNRECYELLATVRTMAYLDSWYPMVGLEDEIEQAATALRREVTARV